MKTIQVSSALSLVGKPVAYYPSITRAFGGDPATGIIICQFMYWRGKVGNRPIYKTRSEIEAETAIAPHIQKRIFAALKKDGFVTIEKKGLPAKNYYSFNWQAIDESISNYCGNETPQNDGDVAPTSGHDPSPLVGTNRSHWTGQIVPTTSETTTENTNTKKKINKKESPPAKRKHPLPDDWRPEDSHHALAAQLGVSLSAEAAKFADYHAARGNQFVAWGRAFNNWLRIAKQHQGKGDSHHDVFRRAVAGAFDMDDENTQETLRGIQNGSI